MPYYSELGIYMSPTSSYAGPYVPAGPYSNHSSLLPSNFTRPPPSLLKPRNFRNYKPHLATITENQSQLRRVNSPKLRLHSSPKVIVAKPIKINTADIDVSVNKYRKYERNKASIEDKDRKSPVSNSQTENSSRKYERSKTPVEDKDRRSPVSSSQTENSSRNSVELKEATPNKVIRRDRPTVRIQTIHTDMVPVNLGVRRWRDNFEPQELYGEEEKRPKKTPGELLKEKFWIRSREDMFAPSEKKISRRNSKKAPIQKTPSFHDICQAITTDQIDEELNPGQPIEIQRRQSRQISTEEIIKEMKRNSADLNNEIDVVHNQQNNKGSDTVVEDNNYDSRGSVRRKKKLTKKKSNEQVVLKSETDGNKSGLQRRLTQKKIRRTSTDSSIGSDIVDPETEKAYQEAIRDISQVEIEKIKIKPKPIITAIIDIEEKPTLKVVVDDVEVIESPKPKKTNKFKFNVIVEEIKEPKQKTLDNLSKVEEQKGIMHSPKPKEILISNFLKNNRNGHMGHVLKDINETLKKEENASKQNQTALKDAEQKKSADLVAGKSPETKQNLESITPKEEIKKNEDKVEVESNITLKKMLSNEKTADEKLEDDKEKKEKEEVISPSDKFVERKNKVENDGNETVIMAAMTTVEEGIKKNENDTKILSPVNQTVEEKKIPEVKKSVSNEKLLEIKRIEESISRSDSKEKVMSPTNKIFEEKEVPLLVNDVKKDVSDKKINVTPNKTIEKKNILDVKKSISTEKVPEMKKIEESASKNDSKDKVVSPVSKIIEEKGISELKKTEGGIKKSVSFEKVPKMKTLEENKTIIKSDSKDNVVPSANKAIQEMKKIEDEIKRSESDEKLPELKKTEEIRGAIENKTVPSKSKMVEEKKKLEESKKTGSIEKTVKKEENKLIKSKSEQVVSNKTEEIMKTSSASEVVAPKSDEVVSKVLSVQEKSEKVKQTEKEKVTNQSEDNDDGENFWATLGTRESIYLTPKKIKSSFQRSQNTSNQDELLDSENIDNESIPEKYMPSKRSLVNKATKDDPDLEVFIPPPTLEPEPEPEPEPESKSSFVPLQSNRLSQFMNPFKKPEQYDECPVEIYATPKVIRKRHYPKPRHPIPAPVIESDSDEDEEEETTDSEDTSSDDEYDVNVVYGNKVGASTSSNDSGFDSGVPGSRNKDCDVNCHKKCEKLTANLCGVNQKLIVEAIESVRKGSTETRDSPTSNPSHNPAFALDSNEPLEEYTQSSIFVSFQKSGRITPPATTIPRFRKYCVDDFNFLKVLGKGSFGKVLLAELKNTEYYYAIKCLKKDVVLEDDDVECTLIERKVLALATKHPYLCHLLCTFQTESHLFFVMEYLNGGDLMFHIQQSGRFPEARARFYGAEIVSGLKFLHNKGIVYRDLKLDNILLDFDGHVRIADFGMCKLQIFLDRMADTFCGTPDYMAPEIIKGQHYNQCVDWWSFGVLLYEMLIGQSPFSGCDEDELFWSICNEKPVIPRFLSAEASAILILFLEKDANKRLGNRFCPSGDIQDQSFFKPIQWDRLEARMLEPPFKPNLQHPLDTQYFDKTFTVEKAKLTPIEQNILQSMDQTQFQGFSYTNPNATDK